MTTNTQKLAMVVGIVFVIIAIVGFISPGGMAMTVDPPAMLFGLFPVNVLHNVVHLLFGVWGLAASRSWSGAKSYGLVGGAIYLVLAICGYFIPNGFGLIPLGGNDPALHIGLGLALLAIGLTAKAETVTTTV